MGEIELSSKRENRAHMNVDRAVTGSLNGEEKGKIEEEGNMVRNSAIKEDIAIKLLSSRLWESCKRSRRNNVSYRSFSSPSNQGILYIGPEQYNLIDMYQMESYS